MYGLPPQPETLTRAVTRTLRDYAGPLAVAGLLLLSAGLIRNLAFVPGDPALTWADLASTLIGIAGEALVILVAGWSVISGGRPAGFAALRLVPPERALGVLAYAVVFYLWLFVLMLIFGALAGVLAAGQSPLVGGLIVALFYAAILVLMWLQLGFLFPDMLASGESGVFVAMALGVSTGKQVVRALALPALCLTVPIVTAETLIWDETRIVRISGGIGALTFTDAIAEVGFAFLGVVETAAYMIAMTRLYRRLTPGSRISPDMWR